ncbi:hypothetical protein N7501_005220, partial [Penicillium viridicatum]
SSPKKDLPALIWTPSHFLPPSSSSSLPSLCNSILYNSFVSFVWVIVRLYFPVARHARFARASIPRCSLIGAIVSAWRQPLSPSPDFPLLETPTTHTHRQPTLSSHSVIPRPPEDVASRYLGLVVIASPEKLA